MLGRATVAVAVAVGALSLGDEAAAQARSALFWDVSCVAANRCMAVGHDRSNPSDEFQGVAESWNGSTWTVTPTRAPARASGSHLWSVSCHRADACMAVGDYETPAFPHGRPFAQRWDGSRWMAISAPRLRDSDISILSSVSCGSENACVAVGNGIRRGHNNAMSAVWNGRRWRLADVPLPRGTTFSGLRDVSCTGPRRCMAVGEYQVDESSKSRTLAEVWNGRRWTIRRTPNPRSGPNGSDLKGVSCASARACMAVGLRTNHANSGPLPVTARWNGTAWKLTKSADQAGAETALSAVSCASARACQATGTSFTANLGHPFAQTWNGSRWSITGTPAVLGATTTHIESISCASARACLAIGAYSTTTDRFGPTLPDIPLAMTWNGTAWAIAPPP